MAAIMTDHNGALDLGGEVYPGLLAAGSPGGIGTPEVWADAAMLEYLTRERIGDTLLNCVIVFYCNSDPVTYVVISRRWSHANSGRPYYVLAWPD